MPIAAKNITLKDAAAFLPLMVFRLEIPYTPAARLHPAANCSLFN